MYLCFSLSWFKDRQTADVFFPHTGRLKERGKYMCACLRLQWDSSIYEGRGTTNRVICVKRSVPKKYVCV